MKRFFAHLRDIALAGFLFLLPMYILFIVGYKAWNSFTSLGTKIADFFGVKSILGVGGSNVFSGLLIIALWLVCGLLVRFSFVAAFKKRLDKGLSEYIPGYDTYKMMAEDKLLRQARMNSYACALIKQKDYWQPAYIIEQDPQGNALVFIPGVPDTQRGDLLLARPEQIRLLHSVNGIQLEALLKKMGKGLLSVCSLDKERI